MSPNPMDSRMQQRSLKDILGYISGAYGQVKTEAQSQYEEMLKTLEGTTGQREADIRSSYAGQESNIMQQLARQGMSGTTIAPTMQMGVARERESALNRLADEMLGTKLGVMQGKTGALTQLGVGEISQKLPLYQQLAELAGI
uniref:Uncharacterized protein n=1 Tax=viral metagenome TaxID=1070528 RepID=A0A6M3KVV0_9ZZZZ